MRRTPLILFSLAGPSSPFSLTGLLPLTFAEPDPWAAVAFGPRPPTHFLHDVRNTTLTSGWAVAEGGLVPGQVMPGQDCKGDAGVSDCPYHVFRTSDDIYNHWGALPPVSSVLLPLR